MKLGIIPAGLLACACTILTTRWSAAAAPSAPAGGGDAAVTLVRGGRSEFGVLVAPDAPRSVKTAAGEFQRYVEKATGARLPLLTRAPAAGKPFVSLGATDAARAAGLTVDGIGLEGFRIAVRGGNVYILGPDTPDGAKTKLGGTSNGTANGVYTFLEDYLDVRWLLPGELGEDVPALDVVTVPRDVDRTEAPVFQSRRIDYVQGARETVGEWSRRQKLGYSVRVEHHHNWLPVIKPEMFAAHPEWFAEVDGKQLAPTGDRYKVETTHPEVVRRFADAAIAAFRADPSLYTYSLSPSDGGAGWSQSAETRALLETDPHGKVSRTKLILKFYNDVARLVGKEFPDRKVAGYIYASYLYPPADGVGPMEPNLFITIATSISYGYKMYRPAVQQEWDALMKEWASQTENISYYDLFNRVRHNGAAITPPAPEILDFAFPRLADHNVKGTYIYGAGEWSQAGVNNYALAKLSWNPRLSARDLCNEFYRRAYGPAAAPHVQRLYELVDAAVKDFYNRNDRAGYVATPTYMREVLGANYAEIERLYLAAERVAATTADTTAPQKARLDFFRDNLILMQWRLRQIDALPAVDGSPLYRGDDAVAKMIGRVEPGFGVALGWDVAKSQVEDAKSVAAAAKAAQARPRPTRPAPRSGGAIDADADD